ncbi:MAG TPA: hypothetical protein PKJ99_09520 [Thermoanaerobaculales bacterium]|nr:hypothetical protein [Thermoanaerobaculales bacterium]
MVSSETANLIRNFVVGCVMPFFLAIDVSSRALHLKRVLSICETWWLTLDDIELEQVISELPKQITSVFRAMYWEKHLSWHCLSRSVVSSLLAMSVVFVGLNVVDLSGIGAGSAYAQSINACTLLSSRLGVSPWLVFLVPFLLNLVIDYVSLLETRFVLSRTTRTSAWWTVLLTVADYAATTLLWSGSFLALVYATNTLVGSEVIPFVTVASVWDLLFFPFVYAGEYIRMGSIASGKGVPVGHLIGLFAFSTYFTSAVFYVFSGTTLLLRLVEGTRKRILGLLEYYIEKEKPGPIGLVGVLVAALTQMFASIIELIEHVQKR